MDRNLGNPFDDSAPERLRHMGLLTAEGAPEEDALAVIERLYAGLFYDALFDFYDDMGNVNAICLELAERLGTGNPRRSFLNICSAGACLVDGRKSGPDCTFFSGVYQTAYRFNTRGSRVMS